MQVCCLFRLQRVLLPDLGLDLGLSSQVEGETDAAHRKHDSEQLARARKFLMYWCRLLLNDTGLERESHEYEFAEQINFLAVIRSNPFQSYGYSLLERLFNVQEGSEPTKIEAALAR